MKCYCVVDLESGEVRYQGISLSLAAKALEQGTTFGEGRSKAAAELAAKSRRTKLRRNLTRALKRTEKS